MPCDLILAAAACPLCSAPLLPLEPTLRLPGMSHSSYRLGCRYTSTAAAPEAPATAPWQSHSSGPLPVPSAQNTRHSLIQKRRSILSERQPSRLVRAAAVATEQLWFYGDGLAVHQRYAAVGHSPVCQRTAPGPADLLPIAFHTCAGHNTPAIFWQDELCAVCCAKASTCCHVQRMQAAGLRLPPAPPSADGNRTNGGWGDTPPPPPPAPLR